ncbi:MAG: KpsF/GutQ family sugar-phosphate isomerase [Candidatus Cloacimonetes bacterium]|nr:KpsF/GutQ family sugar-phosphate isomerase [Candidatus Cloacimonadota bacterium]
MSILKTIKHEMSNEAAAIIQASERVTGSIVDAVRFICDCKGKLVTTGMGKSGLIARKISATFASTGTTSIYLHPAEGIHGDLGMLTKDDVVLALSNSGTTQELITIIPFIKFNQIPLIAITGNVESILAKHADVVIDASIDKSMEPFGLVPTASTTVQLALGDALAVAVLQEKDFKVNDFALFHPGGTIGKKLLLQIADIYHALTEHPSVTDDCDIREAVKEMSSKGLGCTSVVNKEGKLVGIVTDGDLRRFLAGDSIDMNRSVQTVMTKNPKRMKVNDLAVEALNLMERHHITMLPIVDDCEIAIGLLHLHDLIKAGVV